MTIDEGRKPEGAPERFAKAGEGAPSGLEGSLPKRFSVQRKMTLVARLLRGELLDIVARETNVSVAKLTEWRERALEGAASALKERERDARDDEIARLKSKVGKITMDNELRYAKIAAMEGKRPLGSARVSAIPRSGGALGDGSALSKTPNSRPRNPSRSPSGESRLKGGSISDISVHRPRALSEHADSI
jgi:hypothetical protein